MPWLLCTYLFMQANRVTKEKREPSTLPFQASRSNGHDTLDAGPKLPHIRPFRLADGREDVCRCDPHRRRTRGCCRRKHDPFRRHIATRQAMQRRCSLHGRMLERRKEMRTFVLCTRCSLLLRPADLSACQGQHVLRRCHGERPQGPVGCVERKRPVDHTLTDSFTGRSGDKLPVYDGHEYEQ